MTRDMPEPQVPITAERVAVASLPREGVAVTLVPEPQRLAELADALGLLGLRKLRLDGWLRPEGRHDWRLEASLGATVVQPCTVTLAPVTTRIDEPVMRRYLQDWEAPQAGSEVEMPEDDSTEPLPRMIDLGSVMEEALSLALPLYPRAPGADFGGAATAAPGGKPLDDAALKPFAGLQALRDRLEEARPEAPAPDRETDPDAK